MYGYIYITTNNVNKKQYIGQKASEIFLENKYLGSGKYLKRAINKYGSENFSVKLIEKCNSKEELNEREIYWIKYYDTVNSDKFYNLNAGGQKGNLKGSKLSEETRKKLSTVRKQFYENNNEARLKISELTKGKNNPNYGNHKLKGKKFSEDHNKKISENRIGKIVINNGEIEKYIERNELEEYLKNNWTKGQLFTRRNIYKGTIYINNGIEEKRINKNDINNFILNGWKTGRLKRQKSKRIVSEETRKKISEANKGKLIGEKNPMFGRRGLNNPNFNKIYINNGTRNKMVEKEKLNDYLDNGWIKGCIKLN